MDVVDLQGLHPRFAATVLLHAARKGHAVCGVTPAARRLAEQRDALGASTLIEAKTATVHLMGPGDMFHLRVQREGQVLTVVPLDVIPTLTSGLWPQLSLGSQARPGWWVAEHDLVDALLGLASVPLPSAMVTLCGRRRWLASELAQEADLLQRRWAEGQAGRFSVGVLAEPQRPPVRVEAVAAEEDEPDLGPLHALLLRGQQEGWRPQMTVREALMHHLALTGDVLTSA